VVHMDMQCSAGVQGGGGGWRHSTMEQNVLVGLSGLWQPGTIPVPTFMPVACRLQDVHVSLPLEPALPMLAV
jgi:hypothetical protein